MSRKQEIQRIVASLQAARNNSDIKQVARWVELMIEDARDALVVAGRDGHDAASAKVIMLLAMHKVLTQPSMAEMQAPYATVKE